MKIKEGRIDLDIDGQEKPASYPSYPEECCDAAEISDEDYERWKEGSEKGFWQTYIKHRQ